MIFNHQFLQVWGFKCSIVPQKEVHPGRIIDKNLPFCLDLSAVVKTCLFLPRRNFISSQRLSEVQSVTSTLKLIGLDDLEGATHLIPSGGLSLNIDSWLTTDD